MISRTKSKRRRGTAIVEFTVTLFVLIPLLLGVFVYGFKLIRALKMQQIVRDLGHMYARGVDFRLPASVAVAETLASGFDLSSTGASEVILSQIQIVQQPDCDAGNPATPGQACRNLGLPAFVQKVTLGNSLDGQSSFGNPPLQSDQTVSAADRASSDSAVASGLASVLALNPGEVAFVAEMYNLTPELTASGIPGAPLIYQRAIF